MAGHKPMKETTYTKARENLSEIFSDQVVDDRK